MAAMRALGGMVRNLQTAKDLRPATSTLRIASNVLGKCHRQISVVSTSRHHRQQQQYPCAVERLAVLRHQLTQTSSRMLATDHVPPTAQEVESVDVGGRNGRTLTVQWTDGQHGYYPYSWLRDHCRCETCFDADTGLRRFSFRDVDFDATVASAQALPTGREMRVSWSDGHRGIYLLDWLRQCACFIPSASSSPAAAAAKLSSPRTPAKSSRFRRKYWRGSEFLAKIPRLRFDEVMTDDQALLRWMATLEEEGLSLIEGAPTARGQLDLFSNRVAYNRITAYGETSYVQAKANPSSVAYDTSELVQHNDLSYYQQVPAVQIMHCICQATAEGGDSLLVDGFEAANQLRSMHPDYFNMLANTTIDYYFRCSELFDFYQMSRHRTIELDAETGEIVGINYSTHSRDSFLRIQIDDVEPFYKALLALTQRLYHPDNVIVYKLQPGEIVCFDNWRVLHGRKKFEAAAGTGRSLEHCYIEWDVMHARRRHLQKCVCPQQPASSF